MISAWVAALTIAVGIIAVEQIYAFKNKNRWFEALTWAVVRIKNLEDKVSALEDMRIKDINLRKKYHHFPYDRG
jgi:hypothetical protein